MKKSLLMIPLALSVPLAVGAADWDTVLEVPVPRAFENDFPWWTTTAGDYFVSFQARSICLDRRGQPDFGSNEENAIQLVFSIENRGDEPIAMSPSMMLVTNGKAYASALEEDVGYKVVNPGELAAGMTYYYRVDPRSKIEGVRVSFTPREADRVRFKLVDKPETATTRPATSTRPTTSIRPATQPVNPLSP